jgi:3-oxoacyl-(acyl-carrier-protein) synthase
MSERVFITGFGLITAIGSNKEENFQSLVQGKHGFGHLEILETIHRQDLPACEIKITDEQLSERAGVNLDTGFTRTALLGLLAVQEAAHSAGLSKKELGQSGFLSATTTGGIREYEKYYTRIQDMSQKGDFEIHSDTANPGEHTERIADHLGIRRYLGTVSTACSSSVNTIIQGARLIHNHKLDRVICGGAEALSKFTINGFNALYILDREHCKPFDPRRHGLNLGEGAAYVVLESEAAVKQRGATPLGEVLGFGNTNDAYHQTASSPEGTGAYWAMHSALTTAGLKPAQIDYINAHGTGTENNDLSEGLAIEKLFDTGVPPFSSTKPYTGHTLAAAGSIEFSFCLMALQQQVIFPNLNFQHAMPELKITPVREITHKPLRRVMSNSFGFGGNTSAIILGAVE